MRRTNLFIKRAILWGIGGSLVLPACLLSGCSLKPGEPAQEISAPTAAEITGEDMSDSAPEERTGNGEEASGTEGASGNEGEAGGTEEIKEEETSASEEEESAQLESFVLYFSGIDVWGWVDTQSRSDVNIIAAVNPDTRHIQLINTPRDYYVEMPVSDGMKDKLTHAGIYGVENSVGTLEILYGIEIDYYIRMNFSGFESIIDTLGGVDVYSEYDFTVEPIKHYTEGYNHLTGLEALAFVRERHAFASGDNQRGRNQMALIQAMVDKVCSVEFLLNYSEIMEELTDMFRTNVPLELIADMVGNQLLDKTEWTVDTYSVTGSGGSEKTYSVPGSKAYVMIPDEEDVAEAAKLIEGVLNETER